MRLAVVVCALASIACGALGLSSAPEPTPPAVPSLPAEALANAEYVIGTKTVRLTNGLYEIPAPPGINEPYLTQYMLWRTVAFGDLNGDGVEDAVVTVVDNPIGTYASFCAAAMINQNGAPLFADAVCFGDRDLIDRISIADGLITLDMTVHGPTDPGCCPTLQKVVRYRLLGGKLVAR